MARAKIISEQGKGEYVIKPIYEISRAESRHVSLSNEIFNIQNEINNLNGDISYLESQHSNIMNDLNIAIDNANANTPNNQEFEEQYRKILNAYTKTLTDINKELVKASDSIAEKYANIASKNAELKGINDSFTKYKNPLNTTAWCTDYTEKLIGEVGIIAINDETNAPNNQQLIIDAGGVESDTRKNEPAISSGSMAIAYNLCSLPAFQKWKPRYKSAIISNINTTNDTCRISFSKEFQKSSIKSYTQDTYNIVQQQTIDNVPVNYMTCNASAFEDDDHVIVDFNGDWNTPKVIGFTNNPRDCNTSGLLCYPTSSTMTAGSQIVTMDVSGFVKTKDNTENNVAGNCITTQNNGVILSWNGSTGFHMPPPIVTIDSNSSIAHNALHSVYSIIINPVKIIVYFRANGQYLFYHGKIIATLPSRILGAGVINGHAVVICYVSELIDEVYASELKLDDYGGGQVTMVNACTINYDDETEADVYMLPRNGMYSFSESSGNACIIQSTYNDGVTYGRVIMNKIHTVSFNQSGNLGSDFSCTVSSSARIGIKTEVTETVFLPDIPGANSIDQGGYSSALTEVTSDTENIAVAYVGNTQTVVTGVLTGSELTFEEEIHGVSHEYSTIGNFNFDINISGSGKLTTLWNFSKNHNSFGDGDSQIATANQDIDTSELVYIDVLSENFITTGYNYTLTQSSTYVSVDIIIPPTTRSTIQIQLKHNINGIEEIRSSITDSNSPSVNIRGSSTITRQQILYTFLWQYESYCMGITDEFGNLTYSMYHHHYNDDPLLDGYSFGMKGISDLSTFGVIGSDQRLTGFDPFLAVDQKFGLGIY